MARKRHRKPGNLTQLRAVLWQTILEVEALLDARPPCHEVVLKSAHALAQLAGVYTKLVESSELEARVKRLEERIRANRSAT